MTTTRTSTATESSIIRYKDLEPQWHVPGAKEPGFMRWLISWVGGPPGYVNPSGSAAVVSTETVVGLMNLPVGQRQKGLHYHSVAEIYVILRGELEGYDGKGQTHRAGPMDCMYIPKGVPHGVRNCGSEDCDLIWIHDGIEKVGTSVYYMDGIVTGPPQVEEITIINFKDLEPSYTAHRAKEVEFMRWCVSWVGGAPNKGLENHNPGVAFESDKLAIGMTVLQPGQKHVPHSHVDPEIYVVMRGKGVIKFAEGEKEVDEKQMVKHYGSNEEIGPLDGVFVAAGHVHGVRNHGHEPLCLMWVQQRPQELASTIYA